MSVPHAGAWAAHNGCDSARRQNGASATASLGLHILNMPTVRGTTPKLTRSALERQRLSTAHHAWLLQVMSSARNHAPRTPARVLSSFATASGLSSWHRPAALSAFLALTSE